MNARWPSTRTLGGAGLAVLLVTCTGLPVRLGDPAPFAAELVLLVIGAALGLESLRPHRASGARWQLRVAAGLLLIIVAGHIGRTKKSFPFIPYTMFGRAQEGSMTFYDYTSTHRSGRRTRFKPSTVIATLGSARIVRGLARQLDGITDRRAAGETAAGELALLHQTVSALAREYNRRSADSITHVAVSRVVVALPYDPASMQRRHVLTIAVDEPP